MIKRLLLLLFFLPVSVLGSIPRDIAQSCVASVEVGRFTRTVVYVQPFLGVNLIFPIKLPDEKTLYSLSSDGIFDYKRAKGHNIVPIYFKTTNPVFDEIQDLTIASGDYIFSIALVSTNDITQHCSNIKFTFSKDEIARIEEEKAAFAQKSYQREYASRLADLDTKANRKALEIVGDLAMSTPATERLFVEENHDFGTGSLNIFVEKIIRYNAFALIVGELANSSKVDAISISSINAINGSGTPLEGHVTSMDVIEPRQKQRFVFTTLDKVESGELSLVVKTDFGEYPLEW